MTFPLLFEVYKPRERLQPGDQYLTKPEIAAKMIKQLRAMGFKFNRKDSGQKRPKCQKLVK
jgi:SRSO17 transposase